MDALKRAEQFCTVYDLRVPILMAPMAGACPPLLAIAVAKAGGMGACGALLMSPKEISAWAAEVRTNSNGAFQLNQWIPDPDPVRDPAHEAALREFLGAWGPVVPEPVLVPRDFEAQCEAMLAAGPSVISSIMGLYPSDYVERFKQRGVRWFATVTTVTDALAAEAAGADVIVAQGMEAGGHRGAFNAEDAEAQMIGLFALLPAIVDAIEVPVVATGGIADARGVAAALTLGASAVQIGTGLLRTPEAKTNPAWGDALGNARPEDTTPTRAFSGRLGRSLRTPYTEAAANGPLPAPSPVQGALSAPMRKAAAEEGDITRMQAWAGQSAGLARADSATDLVTELWAGTQALLPVTVAASA